VAFNTATGTLFISDDDQRMVFEVDPVTLEVLSSFSTIDSGCWDAEDIAFDPATGNLFIAGGASKLICEVTFDGIFVSSFNVPEINDPEGIAFDSVSGNLFITSSNHIFEVTRGGVLVRVIDILRPFGVTVLKAITFAPSSDPDDDPTILNLYVADYGADGVSDGRIYEISLLELPDQQRPDLAETLVSNPPESATQGDSFTVTDTVLNQGTAPAGTSTTRYYLSLDTLWNSGDKLLTGSRAVPGLAPGEASSGTVTVTIPSATLPGIYFLLACADDLKVLLESNENNNCRASETQVEVKTPDLVETAVSNPPESATSGGSLTVTDTVLNQGNAPAGASTTRYYLSLDTLRNSVDKRLTGSRAVPGLAPGEASTGTVSVTIPSTTPAGIYFLLACADDMKVVGESNENNNCRASQTQVEVKTLDLVETAVSNPPESATSGGSFTVTDTVLNQGNAPAGASTTRYYLSLDTLRNSVDTQLTGSRAVPGLAPGEASTGTVTVTIPSATPAGIYFLLACADDMKVVPESNENNNCRASQTQVEVKTPDLVETAVSNPPESATAGGSLTVTDTVLNQGNAPAGTSTTRYYLSLDTLLNSGDKRLTGSRAVPGLAPGEASTGTVTVTIPSTTLPGTYFLLACADDKKVVAESNEKNNCLASATQVTVGNQ